MAGEELRVSQHSVRRGPRSGRMMVRANLRAEESAPAVGRAPLAPW